MANDTDSSKLQLDADLLEWLQKTAKLNRRSISKEINHILNAERNRRNTKRTVIPSHRGVPEGVALTKAGTIRLTREWTHEDQNLVIFFYERGLFEQGAAHFDIDVKKFKQYATRWLNNTGNKRPTRSVIPQHRVCSKPPKERVRHGQS